LCKRVVAPSQINARQQRIGSAFGGNNRAGVVSEKVGFRFREVFYEWYF
jgi:hypothetical protein